MKKMLFLSLVVLMVFVVGCEEAVERYSIDEGDDPVEGSLDAPVTLVAYEDFQCGYCQGFNLQVLPRLEEEYIKTGKVKLVFKDFPVVDKHPMAQKAAEAAECARKQGKFWELHDVIFENKESLSVENLKIWASGLGLDMDEFNGCLDSGEMVSVVMEDLKEGLSYGVDRTPTIFINGIVTRGLILYEDYKTIIDSELENS